MFPYRFAVLSLFTIIQIATSLNITAVFENSDWELIGPLFRASIIDLRVDRPNTKILGVTGAFPKGKCAGDVRGLYIANTVCQYMPQGLDEIFPNIEGIQISSTGLKVISQQDLKPFVKLRSLWLDCNKVAVLESNVFLYNSDLVIVNLKDNNLRSIGSGIFDPVDDLQRIYLEGNKCISMDAPDRKKVKEVKIEIAEKCQSAAGEQLTELKRLVTLLQEEVGRLEPKDAKLNFGFN